MAKDRFLAQGVTTKRQRNGKFTKRTNKQQDDIQDSDSEVGDIDDLSHRYSDEEDDGEEDEDEFLETAADKRLRLAKDYIGRLKESTQLDAGEYDAAQIDRDLIAERLMSDAREKSGRWSRRIAGQFAYPISKESHRLINGGRTARTPTCVAITADGKFVYGGGKDGSLVKWDRETGQRLKVFSGQKKSQRPNHSLGHCDHILSIAVSHDNKYVATGGRDRRIHIWSIPEDKHLIAFHQHKDSVTGLVFRRGMNQLYSCSADRMVKLWNVDELAYMDTLFGHQDSIASIDALQRERAVTTGSRDKTVRLWKIADEAQLVFRGGSATDSHRIIKALMGSKKHKKNENAMSEEDDEKEEDEAATIIKDNSAVKTIIEEHQDLLRDMAADEASLREGSLDSVTMIDEETFVTGGDSGALCLWSIHKKKPIFIQHVAHGFYPELLADDQESEIKPKLRRPRWITALVAVPFTDMFVSGSSDGYVRVWRLRAHKTPGFDLVNVIPVDGIVNGLAIRELTPKDASSSGVSLRKDIALAVAAGREPRLGRWAAVKCWNAIRLFTLSSALVQKD